MSTATDQTLQKSLKRWYYPLSHRLNVNVMLSNIIFLMIFCGFSSVAVYTMDKLQFLVWIFAVLLSKLCNVLLRNYKIYYLSSISILKIASLRHIKLSKIKHLNFTSRARDQFALLCQISSKCVKELQRYSDLTVFKMAAVRHLAFLKFNFFTVAQLRDPFCISLPNFIKTGQTVAKISRFFCDF